MTESGSIEGQEILGISEVDGPIIVVDGVSGVGYDEVVGIIDPAGDERLGRVLESGEGYAVIEVFSGTAGLSLAKTKVRFAGSPMRMPVAEEMLGRVFDGLGRPFDGQPAPIPETWAGINGHPINPTAREYPQEIISTGLSAIDGMNTLVLGQKLAIFSGSGLPHDQMAVQIVRQSSVMAYEEQRFVVVFCAIGVKHDVAEIFRDAFHSSGSLTRTAMFLNLANDPPVERIVTPRVALTLAEFLAFQKGMHVLAVLTDMTNYCEALRQVSSVRGEIPGRKGYPSYLYSDLASLYERSGRLKGQSGSVTQLPILTMPNDDITHPVPDLTGYITEGQVVLSQELSRQGIYPPVSVIPSLSRMMKDSIGENFTRADHPPLASQLYAAYASAEQARALAAVIGEEGLSAVDQAYLEFGKVFEEEFINQGKRERRAIDETLDLGWEALSILPRRELTRVRDEDLAIRYRGGRARAGRPEEET